MFSGGGWGPHAGSGPAVSPATVSTGLGSQSWILTCSPSPTRSVFSTWKVMTSSAANCGRPPAPTFQPPGTPLRAWTVLASLSPGTWSVVLVSSSIGVVCNVYTPGISSSAARLACRKAWLQMGSCLSTLGLPGVCGTVYSFLTRARKVIFPWPGIWVGPAPTRMPALSELDPVGAAALRRCETSKTIRVTPWMA